MGKHHFSEKYFDTLRQQDVQRRIRRDVAWNQVRGIYPRHADPESFPYAESGPNRVLYVDATPGEYYYPSYESGFYHCDSASIYTNLGVIDGND